MADPVTNNYSLVQPTVGGDTNLWGGILNSGVIVAVDSVLAGVLPVSITSVDVALTAVQFQNAGFALSGTLTADRNLTIPLSPNSATVACAGRFFIDNQTSGAFNVTVKTVASGSTGVVVPQGLRTWLYSDGTNVKYADDSKVYISTVSGSPNGQLAGTTGTVNNPPFPLAFDYTNKQLYLPITTGDASTTVWNKLIIGSSPLPTALFTSLTIQVASNTTVVVAATGVSVTDGAGTYQTVALASTINIATTGVNGLDVPAVAAGKEYAVWAIAKIDGTAACLASLSFTFAGLALPSGYTFAGRIGVVKTAASVAQLLGTWQYGRTATYKVGLAQTTTVPNITFGAQGTYSATSPLLVTKTVLGNGFVAPSTASRINLVLSNQYNGGTGGSTQVAPSMAWSGTNNGPSGSNGLVWPFWAPYAVNVPQSASGWMTLEGTTIAYAGSTAGSAVSCLGWEDNL